MPLEEGGGAAGVRETSGEDRGVGWLVKTVAFDPWQAQAKRFPQWPGLRETGRVRGSRSEERSLAGVPGQGLTQVGGLGVPTLRVWSVLWERGFLRSLPLQGERQGQGWQWERRSGSKLRGAAGRAAFSFPAAATAATRGCQVTGSTGFLVFIFLSDSSLRGRLKKNELN